MLFRDLKTGLAIGLTALLFSSVAGAATIGGAPPDTNNPATPQDDRMTISRLPATTIATEIFGGSARVNSRMRLSAGNDDVFLRFSNRIRYPDKAEIDLKVSGAAFVDASVTAVGKQNGLKAMTTGDATADPPVEAELVPLFVDDGGLRAVTMDDLFTNGERFEEGTTTLLTGLIADSALVDAAGTAHPTGVDIDEPSDVVASLIPYPDASNLECIFNPRGDDVIRTGSCGPAMGQPGLAALHFGSIVLDSAQGLAEPGSTVSLYADIKDADDDEIFDNAPAVTYYRSSDTVTAAVQATGRVGIDANSDPAFSRLVTRSGVVTETSAQVGTVTATVYSTSMGNGDPVTAAALIEEAEIMLSHGVFSDDAFSRVELSGMRAPTSRLPIEDDSVTYTVDPATLASTAGANMAQNIAARTVHQVNVVFNGRDPISSWGSGSVDVDFTDATPNDDLLVPEGASGSLASFSRGGLSTQLNMAQSTYGDGATRYQSWVRVHNNGVTDGSVTITIYDAETGDRLGQWNSETIPARWCNPSACLRFGRPLGTYAYRPAAIQPEYRWQY